MLIFQSHLPHIITNRWWPLHDLSHLKIIFWKARFPYQHAILKHWPPTLKTQIKLNRVLWPIIKLMETPSLEQSAALMISSSITPDIAAFVVAAALVECALNLNVSTPTLYRHDFNQLAIVLM